jgi:hypothetical protein
LEVLQIRIYNNISVGSPSHNKLVHTVKCPLYLLRTAEFINDVLCSDLFHFSVAGDQGPFKPLITYMAVFLPVTPFFRAADMRTTCVCDYQYTTTSLAKCFKRQTMRSSTIN